MTVSRLIGIVSVIAGLFTLLVGLAFNSHFEQLHQDENMNVRFKTLGAQIEGIATINETNKVKFRERLVRIETKVEHLNKEDLK